MRGPNLRDYDGDRDAYEAATLRFESDEETRREDKRDQEDAGKEKGNSQ
jgi:hypothetical protein